MSRITHPENPKVIIQNNTIYWNMDQQPRYRDNKGPYSLDKDGSSTVPQIYEINGKTLRNFRSIPEPGESLQDMRPDIAAEYICLDSELDYYKQHGEPYLKPKDIKWGIGEYAWFKCSNPQCQHVWKTRISNRTARKIRRDDNDNIIEYVNAGIGCPLCSNNKNESVYEEYLYQLLKPEIKKRGFTLEKHIFIRRFDNNYENSNKSRMNFDLYIPQIRTFIDFNGGVHRIDSYKKRDNEKKSWAYSHGFNLIVISCGEIETSVPESIEKSEHYIKYKIHQELKYSPANGCSGITPGTKREIAWAAEQILKEIGATCRPLYYDRTINKYQVDSNMNNYYKNQAQERPIAFDKATGKFKLRNDLK